MSNTYRWLRWLVVTMLVLGVTAPIAVFAAGGAFTYDESSIFEADIEWMAQHEITLGCNPPANDHYCPNEDVTRGHMAALMRRLAQSQTIAAADSLRFDGEGPGYYENRIWASDIVDVSPSTLTTNGIVAAGTTIKVPYDGYLLINAAAIVYDSDQIAQTIWWVQVDDTSCHPVIPILHPPPRSALPTRPCRASASGRRPR